MDDRENVVLDVDEVDFIDMGGLRIIMAAAAEADGEGPAFSVTRGSRPVRRLVELLGLSESLPFQDVPG
jgi:anti-anti-sigma factor